jgi:AsmA-like C-terminal region
VLRDDAGRFNVSTLGAKPDAQGKLTHLPAELTGPAAGELTERAPGAPRRAPLIFLIRSVSIREGEMIYVDAFAKGPPLAVGHLNLSLSGVNPDRPFPVKLGLAALGGNQNLSVSGTIGPIARAGAIEPMDVPVALSLTAGPIHLDRLRDVPELRNRIPEKLSMPDPIMIKGKIKGTLRDARFDIKTDLGAARLVYLGVFHKPAGTAFKISASGFRRDGKLGIFDTKIQLADLKATLSDLNFGNGAWSTRVDTNRFDLAPVAKMAAALAKYALAGSGEAHLTLASGSSAPRAQGAIALSDASFKVEGSKLPGISGLTGSIGLDGNAATLEPTSFNLGSARATIQGRAASLQPPRATYSFSADNFKLAELMPQRPEDEEVSQLTAQGTIAAHGDAIALTAVLASGRGMVSDVPYRNLAMRADYNGHQVNITSLTIDAYGGSVAGKAAAALAPPRPFRASVELSGIDLEQALAAQHAKAANTVRGSLSGQINVAGAGRNIEEIKPTLQGNGRIEITGGKLLGVNVIGTALKKIGNQPMIGTLFTPEIIEKHPALFSSPDTDLKTVHLSYVMLGPRMVSRDITVVSDDYNVLGQGWFDMDRNLDLSVHVVMSREFSSELQVEKKNVEYLENQDGQIEIPLLISGRLPKPLIQPKVQMLVQRAAGRALQEQGPRLLKKFINGGLGKFLGGGGGDSGGGGAPNNPPSSNPLENLFR